MARRTTHERCIVLDQTKLAEQDLILTMLASTGEQVRAVAKGARKPGGRLAARVELFSETDFLIAQGRSLGIVSEAGLVDAHARLRGDLDRVSSASAVCEVAKLTCYEGSADPFLYPLLSRTLTACEQAADRPHLDVVVAAYTLKACAHGGWRPRLARCVACGDTDVSRFSVAAGGVLCESCAKDVAGAEPVSRAQLSWIGALIGSTFDQLLEAAIDEDTSVFLLGLAHRWAATYLDARLRAYEFLLSV